MGRSAIFLDRDGIVNKAIIIDGKPHSPKYLNEVVLIKGIEKLLKYLSKKYLLIGVTNQPEISRGTLELQEVNRINNYLKTSLSNWFIIESGKRIQY